ncbi:NUDIX hydrolase [Metapseudomonas sp. CR3202]|uniref:hypothetical protein n=1 Tax=Pseudomonas sp. CR3202 TaxID=3351532 RepID=UPI003BF45EAC
MLEIRFWPVSTSRDGQKLADSVEKVGAASTHSFGTSEAPQPLNEIAECRWFRLDVLDDRKCHKAVSRLFKAVQVF